MPIRIGFKISVLSSGISAFHMSSVFQTCSVAIRLMLGMHILQNVTVNGQQGHNSRTEKDTIA